MWEDEPAEGLKDTLERTYLTHPVNNASCCAAVRRKIIVNTQTVSPRPLSASR